MDDARPRKEFLERCGNLLVGWRISMSEVDWSVSLTRLAGRYPIEIAFAIRGKRETLTPPLRWQINSIFLALEIERKKCFDPFRRVLQLGRIFGIGGRTPDFNLLGEDSCVVIVKGDEPLRKRSRNSLLHLRRIRMDEPAAERIASGLNLVGSEAVAQLMHQPSSAHNRHENHKRNHQRPKSLGEQCLHALMILEESLVSSAGRVELHRKAVFHPSPHGHDRLDPCED